MCIGAALCLAACGNGAEPAPADDAATLVSQDVLSRASTLAMACSGCHSDGQVGMAKISGLTQDALRESLLTYKAETDGTTVMHRLARGYSDQDIADIAAYLSAGERAQ